MNSPKCTILRMQMYRSIASKSFKQSGSSWNACLWDPVSTCGNSRSFKELLRSAHSMSGSSHLYIGQTNSQITKVVGTFMVWTPKFSGNVEFPNPWSYGSGLPLKPPLPKYYSGETILDFVGRDLFKEKNWAASSRIARTVESKTVRHLLF